MSLPHWQISEFKCRLYALYGTQLLVEIYSLKYHLNAADISKDQIMQSVEYVQLVRFMQN